MKTQWIRVAAMALGTMALTACGERGGARSTPLAEAPATAQPAASSAPPTPAPVAAAPSAIPAAVAPAPVVKAPEPRRATLAGDERIKVKRLVLAQGVKNHEPVAASTTFAADARKIYAFVELDNEGRAPGEIVVEFEPPGGGAPRGDVTLAVGAAPRWRTWAYTRAARVAGSWTAVVKNRRGDVLARAPFEVTL